MNGDRAARWVASFRYDYSGTSIDQGAYLEIASSLSAPVREIEIFDSSTEDLVLAIGPSGSEADRVMVPPGGLERQPMLINQNQRVSISPVSGNAATGIIIVNFWG